MLLCLISALLMTGCFGGMEVNDRAFVQLIGLERQNELYVVTLQIYKSESGSTEADVSKPNSFSVLGEGATIRAAIADAELSLGKRVFLGHLKLLIIGKGITNPADELTLFLDGSVSPSCPVAYSEDPAAVANVLLEESSFSAEQLLRLMDSAASQGKTIYTSIADVAAESENPSAAALPNVRAKGDTILFDGLTFAQKDGTSGFLAEEDVLGVKLLRSEFESGDNITVPVIVGGKRASAFITYAKTRMHIKLSDGKLHISANIRLKVTAAENPYGIDETLIEQAVRKSVGDACTSAFSTAVWYNSRDIFGIKKLVRRDCPGQYEEYLANSEILLAESILTVNVTDIIS